MTTEGMRREGVPETMMVPTPPTWVASGLTAMAVGWVIGFLVGMFVGMSMGETRALYRGMVPQGGGGLFGRR